MIMNSTSTNIERVTAPIDDHSYLVTYHRDYTKVVIVFVHGIFGHYKETWQNTPVQLMTSPILSHADWGSFGYGTSFIDFRDSNNLIEQLVLWARTHLARYEQIYFVAHSMGGLIVRNACAKLALSSKGEDHRLFSKVKQCFLIAVPVSGARAARILNYIPVLRQLNWRIPYLAQPEVSRDSFKQYETAIRAAEKAGLVRPKFSLFVGTNDRVVASPDEWAVTKDDEYEGPIPGDHDTVKRDLDGNSTLIKRIVQIVNSHVLGDSETQRERLELESRMLARQKPQVIEDGVAAAVKNSGRQIARDVVLLSCSFQKRTDGELFHSKLGGVADFVKEPKVSDLALQTRVQMMSLIQRGRMEGTEFKEGNRLARNQNRELILGPDFGGAINEARYLPAYWRYSGRSYQATSDEWSAFLEYQEDSRPSVLIMSGLYGLLPFQEQIQNYDCHMTDTDTGTGQIVRDYWGTVITDVLISHLEWLEEKGWQVGRIVDLLSERSYQSAIDWQRVYPRWSVLHRVFEKHAGRNALANLGVFVRSVVQNPTKLRLIQPDQFIDELNFIQPDRIAFESRLQESRLSVTRE
jgi:pimeloyl-ACP methyl ester carboxylesterase